MTTSNETKEIIQARIEERKMGRVQRPPVGDPEIPSDLVVIARNPSEMQVAQQKLVAWAQAKVRQVKEQLDEAEESQQIAADNGWKLDGFKTCTRLQRERLNYYLKVCAALEAGYVIVPNFDLDIFAIRTTKDRPKNQTVSRNYGRPHPSELENKTNRPQIGEGNYVDPWPVLSHEKIQITGTTGNSITKHIAKTEEWGGIDFPFKFAKPQIMDDTARAMQLKIFDEIGVSPHRSVRKQDPMVVGQIVFKNSGYTDRRISFLLTWWVSQSDLEV